MRDITDPRLIWLKGILFAVGGIMACFGLLLEAPSLRVAFFLGVAIWSFARAYYFAFYVIERYVDPGCRFAGLWGFAQYALARRAGRSPQEDS